MLLIKKTGKLQNLTINLTKLSLYCIVILLLFITTIGYYSLILLQLTIAMSAHLLEQPTRKQGNVFVGADQEGCSVFGVKGSHIIVLIVNFIYIW